MGTCGFSVLKVAFHKEPQVPSSEKNLLMGKGLQIYSSNVPQVKIDRKRNEKLPFFILQFLRKLKKQHK